MRLRSSGTVCVLGPAYQSERQSLGGYAGCLLPPATRKKVFTIGLMRSMMPDDMLVEGFEQVDGPRYRHTETGVSFTLVDADEFTVGMSDSEEQLLREYAADDEWDIYEDFLNECLHRSRPTKRIHLNPFLIADFPLTVDFVTNRWGFADLQLSKTGAAYVPDSKTVLPLLMEIGFRLPSETEWEYCHRRFTPLNGIPGKDMLQFEPTDGLGGFGSYCEILADAWHVDLTSIPNDGTPRLGSGRRTVRGGAANDHPWQGCGEWLSLLPYFRHFEHDGLLSVRPAVSVAEA